MKKHRKLRIIWIVSVVASIAIATACVMYALKSNINLYFTPTELLASTVNESASIRLGGMVLPGSINRLDGLKISFIITDYKSQVFINYEGVLPDLFAEGKGVIVEGSRVSHARVYANRVLAKHDEKYMPPNIAKNKEAQ